MKIDKEISEMVGRIAKRTKEILEAKDKQIKTYEHEIVYLDKKIEVLRKALELMSISFFGNVECIYFPATETKIESNVDLYDYFIQQAKESLK